MKTIKLGELCDINPKDAQPAKGTLVSFIPMQRVSETGLVDTTETRQSEEVVKGFSSFREGDILMAKITPCMENGKGGIAKGLCNGIGYGSTEFHVIRPTSPLIRTEWIYYYTTYPRFRKLCEQNMTGSAGQKRVPKSYLLGCPIPVPDLNTQDKVIHSLRSLRSIIELRNSQLAKLDELVKCRFVELFGDPLNNTFNYPVIQLKDIAMGKLSYGISATAVEYDNNIRYIRITDIDDRGDLGEDTKSPDKIEEKYILDDGDILFARTGATVGKTFLYRKIYGKSIYAGFLIRLKTNPQLALPEYVYQYTKSPYYENFVKSTQRVVAQPNINAAEYGALQILLPPINKQQAFAAFVQRIDKLRFISGRKRVLRPSCTNELALTP